ncbi:hypothetical protein FHW69_000618 [Luteibacter sp. Sphag1AF]|uniref:trypsin n=1 Tax=Luteibacter sp. Sphag1AF TaxID=2587031 RepID=UPI001608C251|nr:trypsin [Luteibacter sp. Sphag1AF]MBB3226028.1 hypothetical protein [Luteibacter sp. Sphag1AF]
MGKSWWVSACIVLAVAVWTATASPARHVQGKANSRDNGDLLASTAPGAQRFRAVGQLVGHLHCTASLVAGTATPSPDTPALVLTAGHCAARFGGNDVMVDQPAPNGWQFTPAYFFDTKDRHHPFAVDRILYATMKGVDVAVLQLRGTYGDMEKLGITPMHISQTAAVPEVTVELAHIPVMDVPGDELYLRHSVCHAGAHHRIYEDDPPWIWPDAGTIDCARVAQGTSGSPLVLKDASEIVGVVNTMVATTLDGCGLSRPCELVQPAGHSEAGAKYFVSAVEIARAITPESKLDLSRLDTGHDVVLKRETEDWITQSKIPDAQGVLHRATWSIRVEDGTRFIRYKTGLGDQLRCEDPAGYSSQIDAGTQPLTTLLVPEHEGIYMLCVIGQADASAPWQPEARATVVLHQIDDTPPSHPPGIALLGNGVGSVWQVNSYKSPNEITRVKVKFGPRDTTDCNDPAGYFTSRKPWEVLRKEQAPWRFCALGFDNALNASPPAHRDFP